MTRQPSTQHAAPSGLATSSAAAASMSASAPSAFQMMMVAARDRRLAMANQAAPGTAGARMPDLQAA